MADNKEEKFDRPEDTYINFFSLYTDLGTYEGLDEPAFGGINDSSFKSKYYELNDKLNNYFVKLSTNDNAPKNYTSIPAECWAIVVPRLSGHLQYAKTVPDYLATDYTTLCNDEDGDTINYSEMVGPDVIAQLTNEVYQRLNDSQKKSVESLTLSLGTKIGKKAEEEFKNSAVDQAAMGEQQKQNLEEYYASQGGVTSTPIIYDNYMMYKLGVNYGIESVLIAASENA